MKVGEFLAICEDILKLLSKYNVKMSDYQYTELFSDYKRMCEEGYKVTYIVICLSEKYSISEASVYRILHKFRRTINP